MDWADLVTLDLSLFDIPDGKQKLAEQLRDAVHNVGMFYYSIPLDRDYVLRLSVHGNFFMHSLVIGNSAEPTAPMKSLSSTYGPGLTMPLTRLLLHHQPWPQPRCRRHTVRHRQRHLQLTYGREDEVQS